MLSKTIRDALVSQALVEMSFARTHKQKKITRWHQNEDLYYGVKPKAEESRANIDLGRMAEFIHTYLSKIDNPLKFKYQKRKDSQLKRVLRLNAIKEADANADFWDLKDLAGKKQCLLYGRAIYAYYADSQNGYKAHLENVDVYDFLIDPMAGGLDLEKARYMGRYGVVKDRYDLKEGDYIKAEVKRMLDGSGNSDERTVEDNNKQNRRQAVDTPQNIKLQDKDKFIFWEWFTTYEGERYYLLMTESGYAPRVEKLVDIFPATKHFPMGAWPFWSYAASPDLTEFWTPAPADQVREIFMVQNVTINQTVDNVEEHNKPMKVVDVSAIENLADLKYRKSGTIRTKGGFDAQKAIQVLRPPTIDTPLALFDKLELIQEKASGLTAGEKGISGDTKVGIYEGNQANAADRFGLMNKSYSMGYKRFAQLHYMGVDQHLTKRISIEIMGPEGIEQEEVSRRDIFKSGDDFNIIVEASDAEDQASMIDQKNKLTFLAQNGVNPVQNPKKGYEIGAKIAGFTDDEIKQLLDTSEYGDAWIMAEAQRDIEEIIEGKTIKPNRRANLAYKQKFVDYMNDHEEDMSHEQFMALADYILLCEEYVMMNENRNANTAIAKIGMPGQPKQDQPTGAPPAPQETGAPSLSSPADNGGLPVQGY